MTMGKIMNSIKAPAGFAVLALGGALTLSACAYHHPGHHRGHHRGHGEVELELEYRDHDRRFCCKRGRRDWWSHSRRDCRRDGGKVVRRHYCRHG